MSITYKLFNIGYKYIKIYQKKYNHLKSLKPKTNLKQKFINKLKMCNILNHLKMKKNYKNIKID